MCSSSAFLLAKLNECQKGVHKNYMCMTWNSGTYFGLSRPMFVKDAAYDIIQPSRAMVSIRCEKIRLFCEDNTSVPYVAPDVSGLHFAETFDGEVTWLTTWGKEQVLYKCL